jgi:hypothetical protein
MLRVPQTSEEMRLSQKKERVKVDSLSWRENGPSLVQCGRGQHHRPFPDSMPVAHARAITQARQDWNEPQSRTFRRQEPII